MATLSLHVLNKLTSRQAQPCTNSSIGTYKYTPTQPILMLYNLGTISVNLTQPLINIKITTTSEIRVFLRYRAIKAILALKSPKLQEIRRTLKAVATAIIYIVFSANPPSLLNCRTRRTFLPSVAFKTKFNESLKINMHHEL